MPTEPTYDTRLSKSSKAATSDGSQSSSISQSLLRTDLVQLLILTPIYPASITIIMKEEVEEQQQPSAFAGEETPPPPLSTAVAVADPPPPPQLDGYAVSLNIWPPSQRTRDAVVNRLIETLSSPSVLSKRYGTLPHDEASAAARRIEEAAFSASSAAADGGAVPAPRDDSVAFGIEILQIYSKEISRRMMESAKARVPVAPASPPADSDLTVEMALQATPVAAVTDEAESVESEAVAY